MAMKELIFGNNIQPSVLLKVFKNFGRIYPRGDIWHNRSYEVSFVDGLGYIKYLIMNRFLINLNGSRAYLNFEMTDAGDALFFMTTRGWAMYNSLRNDERAGYEAD